MRKIFTILLTFVARLIAVLLAVFTALATILVLLLTSMNHVLLNAETDQRAASENVIYDQLPAFISEQYTPMKNFFSKQPQIIRQRVDTGIRFSPLSVLVLLLLVTVFGVRSLRGWLRWWGIPIFVAALVTLSAGIASLIFFEQTWSSYVVQLIKVEHATSRALLNDLARWLVLEAGILTLVALVLLIISARVPAPPDPTLPPLAPPGMPGGPVLVRPISKQKKR